MSDLSISPHIVFQVVSNLNLDSFGGHAYKCCTEPYLGFISQGIKPCGPFLFLKKSPRATVARLGTTYDTDSYILLLRSALS